MIRPLVLSAVFLAGTSATLPAQSKADRDITRAMEQIGRTVERTVEEALRSVDRSFTNRSNDRSIGQSIGKSIGKTIERTLEQSFDRTFDRDIDDIVDRALDQSGQQTPRRRPTRPHESDDEYTQGGERVDTTFSFSRSGVVELTSNSGDIVVTGWNRAEARVRASTERGTLRWRFSSSRLSIETETYRGRTGETRFEVSVPEGVRVIMRSASGDLLAKGTRGAVSAHTNSGDVDVSDAASVDLNTLSGEIRASRLRGDVEATAVSGSVEMTDVEAGSVNVESTSGDVVLNGVRSKDVSASTVSGEASYQGTIESGGQYEFHSHSGNVTLDVPSNVSARFSVETFSGELDAGGFPVTLQPDANRGRRSRRLEFTLGSGDARVIAETFSGNVELRRATRR